MAQQALQVTVEDHLLGRAGRRVVERHVLRVHHQPLRAVSGSGTQHLSNTGQALDMDVMDFGSTVSPGMQSEPAPASTLTPSHSTRAAPACFQA